MALREQLGEASGRGGERRKGNIPEGWEDDDDGSSSSSRSSRGGGSQTVRL